MGPNLTLQFGHVILICNDVSNRSQHKNVNPFKCVNTKRYRPRHLGAPCKPFNLLYWKCLRIGNRRNRRAHLLAGINLIWMESSKVISNPIIHIHTSICRWIHTLDILGCHNNFINNCPLPLWPRTVWFGLFMGVGNWIKTAKAKTGKTWMTLNNFKEI